MNEIKSYYQDNGKWKECVFLSGEEMTQRATELLRENERLNNRINKAIVYIENNTLSRKLTDRGIVCEIYDVYKLLDILKGSDSNESK